MAIPWATISITAPCRASWFQANTPSSTNPMWLTLLKATSRFKSNWDMASSAPYRMPITARVMATGANASAASGKSGTTNRIIP